MKRACEHPATGATVSVSGGGKKIPAISVGFSTTNKLISRAIRWVTRAPCSHAWVAFDDQTLGMRLVMQAEWWGYEVRPWKRWQQENKLVAEYWPVGPDLGPALRKLAVELGTKYDYSSAFWTGLKGWFKRLFKASWSLRPSRTPHQLMCSEAVTRLLLDGGYDFAPGVDPEMVSPGDLLIKVSKSSEFRKIR